MTALILLPSWWLRLVAAVALLALLAIPRSKPNEAAEPREDSFDSRFSRFRHDLLNDLQLVYGAVQLHKPAPEVLQRIGLELREEPRAWKLQFAAPNAPVTGAALPKKLDIALVSGARVKWSHQEHSVTLEVQKASPSKEEDLCL